MASRSTLLKIGVFSLIVPGTVAGLVPQWLRRNDPFQIPLDSRLAHWGGLTALGSGLLLYAHTAWQFSDEGDGTPSPHDEPDELVTGGIYAYVRNPMYVAVLLCLIGQAFLYRSVFVLWWTIGCWLGFHNRVVEWEEPHLAEKHGAAYEQYLEEVPRWLPRLCRDG